MSQSLYPAHQTLMSLAFLIFAGTFLTGFFFLIEESQIKNHRLTGLVRWLPPLGGLERMHYLLLTIGFVFLSVGMIVGAVLSKGRIGHFFGGDPREIGALITWALYALFLNVRMRPAWRGRKGIALSLLGFAAVILTFLKLKHGG